MHLIVSNAFAHLYTTDGIPASLRTYDLRRDAEAILKKYPPSQSLRGFVLVDNATAFTLTHKKTGILFNVLDDKPAVPLDFDTLATARSAALSRRIYRFMMETAGKQPKEFQSLPGLKRVTLNAEEIRSGTALYIKKINELVESLELTMQYLTAKTLLKTETGLPFNVKIPF